MTIAYARVSSHDRHEGLERQRQMLALCCSRQVWTAEGIADLCHKASTEATTGCSDLEPLSLRCRSWSFPPGSACVESLRGSIPSHRLKWEILQVKIPILAPGRLWQFRHDPRQRFAALTPLDRVASAVSVLILMYAIYSSVHFALQDDVRHLLTRIADDASYYMTIARNIAAGQGATFDRIHATNGFHPLWLLMLVPLFLLHGAPETMIRVVVLLQAALLGLAYLVFLRVQTRVFSLPTAALSAILFLYFIFLPSINGMESPVLILSLIVLYGYGSRVARSGLTARRAAVLGLILGLVVLARLDMIFLPVALLVWGMRHALIPQTRSRAIAMIAACGIATCTLLVPYLAFNYWKFGSVVPISGQLESSFPHRAHIDTLAAISAAGAANLLSAALAIGLSLWSLTQIRSRRQRSDEFYPTAVAVLAWAIVLHFLYHVLFFKWGMIGWHFIPYPLLPIVWISGLLERGLRSSMTMRTPALYAAIAACMCVGAIARDVTRDWSPLNGAWHTPVYNAAIWARGHTRADAVFAMSDCGHFAFFSQRRTVNLDGVVNDMDFQRTLAQHHLGRYLQDNHVGFLVQHAVHNREDVIAGRYDLLELRFPSHWFDGFSDGIAVRQQSEVYRSSAFFDGHYRSVLVIWSLRSD